MQSKLTNLRVTQIYQTRLVVIWGAFKEMQCRQNNVEKGLPANGGELDYKEESDQLLVTLLGCHCTVCYGSY